MTPILFAMQYEDLEMVELLLGNGSDPNYWFDLSDYYEGYGLVSLIDWAYFVSEDMVRLLDSYGAEPLAYVEEIEELLAE